jgi:DNA-binding transcriptional LysR family regulator
LAAVQEGLGLTFLPCFIGDSDPILERYCDPKPIFDLGLWVLIHPELKSNLRVLAFKHFLNDALSKKQYLFEGTK